MGEARADAVMRAKMAETAERYEDMVEAMKTAGETLVAGAAEMSAEERNLLSVAYKNVVSGRRNSWRALNIILGKAEAGSRKATIAKEYRDKVEGELRKRCQEVIALLTNHLVPNSTSPEAKVFFHKMVGDYYRYLAEVATGDEKEKVKKSSEEAYEAALKASPDLPNTNPVRLGLALNYSVFFYEILDKRDKAVALAKKAFDDAIGHVDELNEEAYKDATLILQLLRDNLTLWTEDDKDE